MLHNAELHVETASSAEIKKKILYTFRVYLCVKIDIDLYNIRTKKGLFPLHYTHYQWLCFYD